MELKPKIIDFSQINGGNEYADGDGVGAEAINGSLEASAYAQALATNGIDTTNIESGAPRLYIKQKADGTPQIVAEGLKGQKGDSGISNATLSNEFGESSENGYTQSRINSLIYNENLLINPDFKINQRGKTTYSTKNAYAYSIDRWQITGGILQVEENGNVTLSSNGTWQGLRQFVDNPSRLAGKTITVSAKGTSINGYKYVGINLYDKNGNRTVLKSYTETVVGSSIISFSVDVPNYVTDENQIAIMLHCPTTNMSVTWEWAKIEISNIMTPFVAPSMCEEISKCQYYYKRLFVDGVGYSTSDNLIVFSVPVGNMRKSFTFQFENVPNLSFSEDVAPPIYKSVTTELKHQSLLLKISTQISNLGANNIMIISDGEAYIDAEIY